LVKSKKLKAKKNRPSELEELARLTGELAHEIKNPLSTIRINLRLIAEELEVVKSAEEDLRGSGAAARALRKISVVEKETDRLEQILESFLRYFDRTELQPSSIDINSLINDMYDFYLPQAHSRSITVRLGLCKDRLVCRIDADMLKQAILNLFLNAQQAMSTGGELIIRTGRCGDNARIEVSDTGCGIAAEELPRIFDAYYSSRPEGSGLGLATTRRIVEAHNGKIDVTSEPGKGTCFTIKLPLEKNG